MKILIVDDDEINVQVLALALKDEYQVLTAYEGFTALQIMKDERPDLVLLDIMMPGIDGLEVRRQMRANEALAETPVIFVTAITGAEGEAAGLELGAVDYLTKPVNLNLAKLRIRNQLELKRQRDEIAERNALLAARTAELEEMLARVRRLEGIISICMYCKRIRSDVDEWQQLERYITEHSDAMFSHGMCPDCYARHEASLQQDLARAPGAKST